MKVRAVAYYKLQVEHSAQRGCGSQMSAFEVVQELRNGKPALLFCTSVCAQTPGGSAAPWRPRLHPAVPPCLWWPKEALSDCHSSHWAAYHTATHHGRQR